MSQRWRQQEKGEISLIRSERERQQENGYILDIENHFGGQDDGVNCTNKILDPNKGEQTFMFKYWHTIFLLSCVIAILCVDPLFLYFPVIGQNHKCLKFDIRLTVIALCFRSFFDMIYVGNIILEYFSHRHGRTGLIDPNHRQPWQIIKKYLRLYFVNDILAILPFPQVLIPIIITRSSFFGTWKLLNVFIVLYVLQYMPRLIRLYQSWREYTKKQLHDHSRNLWTKFALNIFLYILASHVVGGLWYFFSIQREMVCWYRACKHIDECTKPLTCGYGSKNYPFKDDVCPIQTPNTTVEDFGIFLEILQSPIVTSNDFPQKIMHCFSWGLRNLSSFGSNLQTSPYFWENCFEAFISIFGLIIFMLFIGNAQTYMQMANEKAQKMRRIKTKIEAWMATNHLPDNMKESIISCIQHELEENKDFNMENPISYISKDEDLMAKIKHHLCLPALLKKVQILNNESEHLLQSICKSLKPLYYIENSYIYREGEPLNAMIFITQGRLWCFKTNNGENGERTTSSPQCIEKCEFYGEELLEWGFNGSASPKLSNFPISKTVITLTKVEAFALTANDWKNIVSTTKEAQNSP